MIPPIPPRRQQPPFTRPPFPLRPPRPLPAPIPFGPGDHANPDPDEITKAARDLQARLEAERARLWKLRGDGERPAGPAADSRHQDGRPPERGADSRADGLWPFLLIRSFRGDFGARPATVNKKASPDIILTQQNPAYQTTVVGQNGIADFRAQNKIPNVVFRNWTYDVWVHVWNLGRAPAHGVRVRAWVEGSFIGGRELDLGDRTSSTSHLLVKVGTWQPQATQEILATAECMSDVAKARPASDPGKDRHTAARVVWVIPMGI